MMAQIRLVFNNSIRVVTKINRQHPPPPLTAKLKTHKDTIHCNVVVHVTGLHTGAGWDLDRL